MNFTSVAGKLSKPSDGLDGVTVELWIDDGSNDGNPTFRKAGSFASRPDGEFDLAARGPHKTGILKARKEGYIPLEQKVQFKWAEGLQGIVTLEKQRD